MVFMCADQIEVRDSTNCTNVFMCCIIVDNVGKKIGVGHILFEWDNYSFGFDWITLE